MDTRFLNTKTILGAMIVVLLILIGVSNLGKKDTKSPGTRITPITAPEVTPESNIPGPSIAPRLPDYPFSYKDLDLELNSAGTTLRVDYTGNKSEAKNQVTQLLAEYNIDPAGLEIIYIGLDQGSNEPPPGLGQTE